MTTVPNPFEPLDPGVHRLVDGVRAAVQTGTDELTTTAAVAAAVRSALDNGIVIPAPFTEPHPERYAMYPLFVEPDGSFSIAVAVWGVGQRTPIHDHLTWGVVGVVSGAEHELRFAQPAGAAPVATGEAVHGPGAVTVCCTHDHDVHQVAAQGDSACVALHVYGADIGQVVRHAFDPETGAAHPFTSTWTQP